MRPDDGAADLVLRPGQRPDHVDRERLVRSDAPEQDLSLAGLRVERPAAVLRDDRNRERPVLGPDIEDAPAGLLRQPVHLAVLGEEPPPIEIVLRGVAGGEDPLIASEDLRERCFVLRLDGSEERLHRRVHGGEGAQADVVRVGRHPVCRCQHQCLSESVHRRPPPAWNPPPWKPPPPNPPPWNPRPPMLDCPRAELEAVLPPWPNPFAIWMSRPRQALPRTCCRARTSRNGREVPSVPLVA